MPSAQAEEVASAPARDRGHTQNTQGARATAGTGLQGLPGQGHADQALLSWQHLSHPRPQGMLLEDGPLCGHTSRDQPLCPSWWHGHRILEGVLRKAPRARQRSAAAPCQELRVERSPSRRPVGPGLAGGRGTEGNGGFRKGEQPGGLREDADRAAGGRRPGGRGAWAPPLRH